MIKIFITEYYIFIEDFDLLFLYDNFFSQHFSLFQGFIEAGWTNQTKSFLTQDLAIFPKTKIWRYTLPLIDIRLVATKVGWHLNFIYNVVPRLWFKRSFFLRGNLPYQYIFVQFYDLNYLVGSSYINFEKYYDYFDNINIRFIDINLLFDSVYGIFPVEDLIRMEKIFQRTRVVFYRLDVYQNEWLLIGLRWYPASFTYSCLNPHSVYLTQGVLYARKWLIYAYLTYNKFPDLNRFELMYSLSTFFVNVLKLYKVGFDSIFFDYIDNYILTDFYVFRVYFLLNSIIVSFLTYIYFCDKHRLFYYAYLKKPLFFFSPLLDRILIVSSFLKRYIRLTNYYWYKKWLKRGFKWKSETESYYFNLIRKYLFRNLFKLYHKYIIKPEYLKKLDNSLINNSADYKIVYWFYLILVSFFSFFLALIIYMKNIIYYIYYFYHLRLNKYVNFKNTLFLFSWFIPEIILQRDSLEHESYEIVKRYLNFKRYHKNKEYRNFIKDQILYEYETRMWEEHRVNEEIKEQYVNYFFYRYFFEYEPWYEFIWLVAPRYLAKLNLRAADPTFRKLHIYNIATVLNFYSSKFFFIKKPKNYRILYVLKHLYNLNFLKLYYFYIYKVTKNKSNNFFKFLELWFIYLYKLYLNICLFYTYMLKFFFTPQRIILKYYFFKSLPIIHDYLNQFKFTFYFIKFIFLIGNLLYLTLYYSFEVIYINMRQFFIFFITKWNNFFFLLFRSDYGYSFNFWYRYYMLKFYFIEYNIFYQFFIFFRNLLFNFIIILSIFYIFFSIPFIANLSNIANLNIYFFLDYIFHALDDFNIISAIEWCYPIKSDDFYIYKTANSKELMKHFVNFFTNNFANYYLDLHKAILTNLWDVDKWSPRSPYWIQTMELFHEVSQDTEEIFGFTPDAMQRLFPYVPQWWVYFYSHFVLILARTPLQFIMWEIYWYAFLPIGFHWIYRLKFYLIYIYIMLPVFWIWQYFVAFITFYCLYAAFYIPPLYYLIFFFFKFMYIIYSYIYLLFIWIFYIYKYQYLLIYHNIYKYLFDFFQLAEIFKYDSLKFYISLDILNFLKLIFSTIYIFLYYFFSGIFLYCYKIWAYVLNFFGFDYFKTLDFFSYNYLEEFRSFMGRFFTDLIPLHYDLDEYNSIFNERYHNKVGRRRGLQVKNRMLAWAPYVKYRTYRTLSFEYKLRGYLLQDTHYLNNMFLYQSLFEFRNWNLFYFMLFGLYFHFFLILFFICIIYLKFINIFKDSRHLSHSGSYEWKRNFIKKNKINLGLEDFYWLYNIRWLKGFEFYLDKHFTDDLYVYKFNRGKISFGKYLYDTLNDVLLTGNKSFSDYYEENRYYKFFRYYFDRYTIFVKDIDYLFHIYSVSKKNLKSRSKIFSIFDFFMPFFNKKKKDLNYLYDNEILRKLDRIDFVWIYYVAPNFFYGRDWYDMSVFSKNLVSKKLYAKLKKSLFKAYAIYEMNQKEFPFDLFEFQFFDKDFFNLITEENFGHDFMYQNQDIDNPVLRKLVYSRFKSTLLYTSVTNTGFKKVYNLIGYDKFLEKMEDYFIYLRKINKNYFNDFIDFNLFSFMESISYTLTHITPDIAKTAVDVDRGELIGVSYKKSMLLDEFTSTEITESVFNAVDSYLKKSNFNNIDVYNMLLREESSDTAVYKGISPWWIILAMIPFFVLNVDFDIMFKYGRFILPNLAIIEATSFITDQIFGIYISDNYSWHGIWIHDHRSWNKKLHYTFKLGHYRTLAWDFRWADLHSFWIGENAYSVKAKLEYAYLFVYWLNDFFHRGMIFDRLWDYYFKDFYKVYFINIMFILLDFFAFIVFALFFYVVVYIYFFFNQFYSSLNKDNLETEEEVKKIYKDYKEKDRREKTEKDKLIEIGKEIEKHRKLVDFIENYKEEQKKKEENKKNL